MKMHWQGEVNNPLIQRVRRHATLAVLMRFGERVPADHPVAITASRPVPGDSAYRNRVEAARPIEDLAQEPPSFATPAQGDFRAATRSANASMPPHATPLPQSGNPYGEQVREKKAESRVETEEERHWRRLQAVFHAHQDKKTREQSYQQEIDKQEEEKEIDDSSADRPSYPARPPTSIPREQIPAAARSDKEQGEATHSHRTSQWLASANLEQPRAPAVAELAPDPPLGRLPAIRRAHVEERTGGAESAATPPMARVIAAEVAAAVCAATQKLSEEAQSVPRGHPRENSPSAGIALQGDSSNHVVVNHALIDHALMDIDETGQIAPYPNAIAGAATARNQAGDGWGSQTEPLNQQILEKLNQNEVVKETVARITGGDQELHALAARHEAPQHLAKADAQESRMLQESIAQVNSAPLESVWPVQQRGHTSSTAESATLASPTHARDENALSHRAQPILNGDEGKDASARLPQETNQLSQQPVEFIRPRQARPSIRPASQPVSTPAVHRPDGWPSGERLSEGTVATEIGQLPADLWQLLGEKVPDPKSPAPTTRSQTTGSSAPEIAQQKHQPSAGGRVAELPAPPDLDRTVASWTTGEAASSEGAAMMSHQATERLFEKEYTDTFQTVSDAEAAQRTPSMREGLHSERIVQAQPSQKHYTSATSAIRQLPHSAPSVQAADTTETRRLATHRKGPQRARASNRVSTRSIFVQVPAPAASASTSATSVLIQRTPAATGHDEQAGLPAAEASRPETNGVTVELDVDALASQVYIEIRRRLEIEQERLRWR